MTSNLISIYYRNAVNLPASNCSVN